MVRDSSVGITTGYGLDDPRIETHEARFFAHFQTGPEAHPASCTMGTGTFPGVKRPGRDADQTAPSSAEVYPPSGPIQASTGTALSFTSYEY
jgi:hypothetical protein